MKEHWPYLSPLSEQELYDLWMDLKREWPVLYEKYKNPNFSCEDYEEELRSVDLGIGGFVHSRFPDINIYPDRINIKRDMRTFFDRYLSTNGLGWKSQ